MNARQAVAYATDNADLHRPIGEGVYTPANGMFAPGQLGYIEDSGYPTFDLDKAKELVAEYTAETGKPLAFTYCRGQRGVRQARTAAQVDVGSGGHAGEAADRSRRPTRSSRSCWASTRPPTSASSASPTPTPTSTGGLAARWPRPATSR